MLEERADEAVATKRASWKKRVNIVRLFWWVLSSLVLFDACGELANCEQRNKDGVKVKCDRAHSGASEEMYVANSDANSDGKIENVPVYDYGGGDIRLCGKGWLLLLIGQSIVLMTRTYYCLSIQLNNIICQRTTLAVHYTEQVSVSYQVFIRYIPGIVQLIPYYTS
jgi:hypothetical protein